MALIAVIVGNGTPGWGDQRMLSAVISTVTWSFAAAAAGAQWGPGRRPLGGAPHQAAARFAGALGPVCLIALVTVASFGLEGPGVAVLLIEAVVEAGAAVAGATALSRRLVAAS